MKIMVVGDLHAEWSRINQLINRRQPDVILQVGDFGWWPKQIDLKLKPQGCKVYWIDGNHEDHGELAKYNDGKIHRVAENLFYCSRGSVLNLNGINILCMGGADSYDKKMRTVMWDWFPQETILQTQLDRAFKALNNNKIDVVISHTAPASFDIGENNDPSRIALDMILDACKPKLWYFGHWHEYKEGMTKGTKWIALDHATNHGTWWKWLEL